MDIIANRQFSFAVGAKFGCGGFLRVNSNCYYFLDLILSYRVHNFDFDLGLDLQSYTNFDPR